MLLIDGARQVGKSYIIRKVGERMFPNYIEINMEEDKLGDRVFAEAKTTKDFYMALSIIAGDKMKERGNTLVFIDEIQAYDHLLTLVKFLMAEEEIYLYRQWVSTWCYIKEYSVCSYRESGCAAYVPNGF